MRARALAIAAGLLALTSPAFAASRSCGLVTDPRGDTGRMVPEVENKVPAGDLDIVGADVATDHRTLTAVLRTATLSELDPGTYAGRTYSFRFTTGSQRFQITTTSGPDGTLAGLWRQSKDGFYEPVRGHVTTVFDYAAREVRVSVPIGVFRSYATLKDGTRLGAFEAETARHVGTSGGLSVRLPTNGVASIGTGGTDISVDVATSKATYVAGMPSCVRVEG